MLKMAKKKRKRLSPELKIKALQDHIIEKLPVSEVCEQMGIQPSAFYLWQRELFARGARVFDTKPGPQKQDNSAALIAALEAKLAKKDECIAELLQDHIALKKSLGEI